MKEGSKNTKTNQDKKENNLENDSTKNEEKDSVKMKTFKPDNNENDLPVKTKIIDDNGSRRTRHDIQNDESDIENDEYDTQK